MLEGSHILIVDDEADIREVLRLLLRGQGYRVAEAPGGREAIEYAAFHPELDLVVLDVLMPELSGYDVCRAIRAHTNAPVLFLTARTGEDERLEAYRRGGDDFLGKPFSPGVLLAKTAALLRRYKQYGGKPDAGPPSAALSIDRERRAVSKNGRTVELTEKEYSILSFLVERRGSAVSASELYEAVWQERYFPSSSNTVMVHILNLRRKVEDDPSAPQIIRTVWGKGYQID